MRHRGASWGGLLLLCMLCAMGVPASATLQQETVSGEGPVLAPSLRGPLFVTSDGLLSGGRIGARFFLSGAYRPIGPAPATGDSVMDFLLRINMAASIGLHDRVGLSMDLPVVAAVVPGPGMAAVGDPERRFAVGDLGISLPVVLVSKDSGFLVVQPRIAFPTGDSRILLSEGTLGLEALLAAGARKGPVTVSGQIRYRAQPWPAAPEVGGWLAGDSFGGALALGVAIKKAELSLEFEGMTRPGRAFQADHSRVGGMVSWRQELSPGVSLMAALGGFVGGLPGSPPFQAGVGVQIAPEGPLDVDQDGVADREDACVDKPEDLDGFEDADGCPDLDNDGDGLADGVDQCPDEAEDPDAFEDGDGCPDLDNDGDGIEDEGDACPLEAEDLDSFEDADGCPDLDNDGDGLSDELERRIGTNPDRGDSDGDGLSDAAEDSNADGVVDPQESSPLLADTDEDGLGDGLDPCPVDAGALEPVARGRGVRTLVPGCPEEAKVGRTATALYPLSPLGFDRDARPDTSAMEVIALWGRLQLALEGDWQLVVHPAQGAEPWYLERANHVLDELVHAGADPERLEPQVLLGEAGPTGVLFWLQRISQTPGS